MGCQGETRCTGAFSDPTLYRSIPPPVDELNPQVVMGMSILTEVL
jgi:hypothetical protein